MNILEACAHPEIFKPWFRKPETYRAWFAFLAALFGLQMDGEQLELYQKHTGRTEAPTEAQREGWLVIGRRGGKSFTMALIAVFLACFFDYRQYLAPGERATVLVIATDRRQARVILRYVRAMLDNIPLLQAMVERDTADSFDLDNSTTIEVGTASFRSTRGYTYAAVLCDELAFWRTDDAAEPDYAILDAIRPGMASIPNSMLLCASSPHARRGALWDAFKRFWGKDDAPLVWRAATREMNPTISQSVVDRALERDHASAMAEYGAEFRSDIEQFVNIEVVEDCVSRGVYERAPLSNIRYRAFVDPSGGSNDSMTLAIGHKEGERNILDCVREHKPPFSPESVVAEFADTLAKYRVREVEGDRYAGEWPREQFRKKGITYKIAEKPRSDLYRDMLPLLNSGVADLLDSDRLVTQIVGLERRVSRGGKESIDHAPGGHDDLANAVAGVLNATAKPLHVVTWEELRI
ncbi:hypothetical protein AMC82_CH03925 [Rhizobium phaseoli]|uniref:terminase large subunit domain-containing protein n=1 Tax=Rhizobium phaseoli TaxID=396 RepID=UPI0007EB186E|nr:terminase family protein [Rhizobium phaseoli]ANL55083.1 hypothetical protein AMC86_CH04001 [Rhizobium phaseoli]ANL67513.1 hypothetical protein AMC84_CH03939 [Rhizobium phaseoli]ANL80326.1 hypothetical protein AMC82_CH03925 [Rhizobium phaseoli]